MGRFLVASAEGDLRKAASAELALCGHEALLSSDPIESMRLASAAGIAGAIVDLELPEPGGAALLARLAADPACAALPLLAVAGTGMESRDRLPGSAALLRRPFGKEELSATLAVLAAGKLPQRRAEPAAAAEADTLPESVPGEPGVEAPSQGAVRPGQGLDESLSVMLGQLDIIDIRCRDLPEEARRRLAQVRAAAVRVREIVRGKSGAAGEAAGANGASAPNADSE